MGTAAPVLAADAPGDQQNPQTATETFSSIALLNYYSDSLNYLIELDQTGSDTNLARMPFANVPQELATSTTNFASNGIAFTTSLVELFVLWNQQNTNIQQYRLTDAATLYKQITNLLPAAQLQLSQIESSVADTGTFLNINSLPADSELTPVYNEITAKLQQLSGMLDLLSRTPPLAASLKPTTLTLAIDPVTAYVGDRVTFTGTLFSQGQPLSERMITLLVNNLDLVTVQTGAQGQFQGTFQLPYLYINQMPVQAIYYPQGNDVGIYLGASSPVIDMTVLFYTAQLTLQVNNSAFPGKETTVTGTFDYGTFPVLAARSAAIYLDNTLAEQFSTGPVFNQGIILSGQITPGKHSITVSASADGRYAPVLASYVLNVTLATTNLDLHLPVIGLIPGSIQISGKLYSSVGPLSNASVLITQGTESKQITTAADGTFSTKIGLGIGFNLLGTQGITVQVQPQEPWNAPLTSTKNIFLINYVALLLILIVLAVLAVYLPRRFKKWFVVQPGKHVRVPGLVPPALVTTHQVKTGISPKPPESSVKPEEGANSIFYWYRVALQLVQVVTKKLLAPHQTLREYGQEASNKLGPAGKHFLELTYLIERRLYGIRKPDAADVQQSKDLALEIQKEAGREQ